MSLPCARGGSGRGTSLTEGLLHTRESDIDTLSASHSFGTSLVEGGKGARARTRKGGGRGSCAGQEKRVRVRAIARRKRKSCTPSASHSFGTSLHEGGKGAGGALARGKRRGCASGLSRGARKRVTLPPPHIRSAPPSWREARGWRGAVAIFAGSLNKTTRKRKSPMSFLIGPFLAIGLSINQTVVS